MAESEQEPRPEPQGRSLKQRLITTVVVIAVIVIAWFVGAAVIPRWWAQRVGNFIDGGLFFGSVVGLATGFLFTALPLAVLRSGWRFRSSWKGALITVAVALLCAAPNLATLGIVTGNGNAAHAGERILDVDGPGFRGGSLIGALAGAGTMLGLFYLMGSRSRNKRKAHELKSQLNDATRSD